MQHEAATEYIYSVIYKESKGSLMLRVFKEKMLWLIGTYIHIINSVTLNLEA